MDECVEGLNQTVGRDVLDELQVLSARISELTSRINDRLSPIMRQVVPPDLTGTAPSPIDKKLMETFHPISLKCEPISVRYVQILPLYMVVLTGLKFKG